VFLFAVMTNIPVGEPRGKKDVEPQSVGIWYLFAFDNIHCGQQECGIQILTDINVNNLIANNFNNFAVYLHLKRMCRVE